MTKDSPSYGVRYFWCSLFASATLAALTRGNLAVAGALLAPAALILLRAVYLRHTNQGGSDEGHHAFVVLLVAGLVSFSLGWVTVGFLLSGPAVTAVMRDWWTWLRPKPGRGVAPQQRRCAKCVPTRGGYCANCGCRLSRQ